MTEFSTLFWEIATPIAAETVVAAAAVAEAYAKAIPKASARISFVLSVLVRSMSPPLPAVVVTSLSEAMCVSIVPEIVFAA